MEYLHSAWNDGESGGRGVIDPHDLDTVGLNRRSIIFNRFLVKLTCCSGLVDGT